MSGLYTNKKIIAERQEKKKLQEDNLLLGQQVSDMEINGIEQGQQVTAMDIRIIELEAK
ncbi:MAG: hypothetical protein WCT05_16750 [Lentisphaeria bacterium]